MHGHSEPLAAGPGGPRPPSIGSRRAPILLVAAACLWGLIVALRHMEHSIWFDEALTLAIAREETLGALTRTAMTLRPYPPLFFVLARAATALGDDLLTVRLLATISGLLTSLALFWTGRQIFDRSVGVVAALLFLTTPGLFRYMVDGNAYTLVTLLTTVALGLLWRAIRRDKARDWTLFTLVCLAGLATHAFFVFHVAAMLGAVPLVRMVSTSVGGATGREGRRLRPLVRFGLRRYWLAAAVLLLAWLGWAAFYALGGGVVRPPDLSRISWVRTALLVPGGYLGPISRSPTIQLLLWPVLQLGGGWALFRHNRLQLILLGVACAVPALAVTLFAQGSLPFVSYRYYLGLFPLSCLVAAGAVPPGAWNRSGARPFVSRLWLLVLIAYIGSGAVWLMRAPSRTFEYQDWRGLGEYLSEVTTPADTVLIAEGADEHPFRFTYAGPAEVVPTAQPIEELRPPVRPRAARGRIWVVLSSFDNENRLVARFTEPPRRPLEERLSSLTRRLEGTGCRVGEVRRFLRLIAVRADGPTGNQPCEVLPRRDG